MVFTFITFRLEGRGDKIYKAPNKIKHSVSPAKLSLTPPTMPSISYTLLLLLSSGKSENPIRHPLPTARPPKKKYSWTAILRRIFFSGGKNLQFR
jgi:hypothetical protein